jgi:hypothetical protein
LDDEEKKKKKRGGGLSSLRLSLVVLSGGLWRFIRLSNSGL